jgi:phospholipid-translocating ATPase
MIKELYDDINRRFQDKKTNNELYTKYEKNIINPNEGKKIEIPSHQIKIGDFLILNENQRIPADMILLKTFNNDEEDNHAYIRTDQLDGETDWKLRKAINFTQKLSISEIININGFIEYEAPSKLIYNFEGVF